MPLSIKGKPYIIPEYSLTGDLLSYLTCGLQYRYHNKGSLPPSIPVQLWFGEFIHGVMEEAYLVWRDQGKTHFPWDWKGDIRPIELEIAKRLKSKSLLPPPNLFCPFESPAQSKRLCPDTNHPHKMIASRRAEKAINTWGTHLFPLIHEAEVKLKGIRDMPNYRPNVSRSPYYGITGVIDVITSINLQNAPAGNLILHYIHGNRDLQNTIRLLDTPEYEIILDYKGMRRPPKNSKEWMYHEWQILTYAWLRAQQPDSKPVIAGILFYLNELALSKEDMVELQKDVLNSNTDVMPQGSDYKNIVNWKRGMDVPMLSGPYLEQRSLRIVPIDQDKIDEALSEFDNVVNQIEDSVYSEMCGNDIKSSWDTNPVERTCTACDFKTFCPNPAQHYKPTVP